MSKKNEDAKVTSTKSVSKAKEPNKDGLVEVELLKAHGADKKGAKLLKHPNTAKMLIDRKIAK